MRRGLTRAAKALGSVLLFAAIALCLAPTLVPPFLDRIYYSGPVSDHFDGAHFFNPGEPAPERIDPRRFLNRWAQGERAAWPDSVPVQPSRPPARVAGAAMLVTWIGHSTVLVQTRGINILTDPIWSERASPVSFAGPGRVREPGVRFEELPRIDLVLVSHNHYDHLDLPTLQRLWARDRPLIVTSLGNDTILRNAGIEARAFDWGRGMNLSCDAQPAPAPADHAAIPPCAVTVERVHHWGSRWGTDRNRALWSGFSVRLPGGNLFFAGDTGWGDGSWVREAARHGPYRFAILPIGAYRPREVMQGSHVDPGQSVGIFQGLNPVRALGVHWGTFQLAFEGIDDPPRDLAAALARAGIAPDRFVTTEVGRSFTVPER